MIKKWILKYANGSFEFTKEQQTQKDDHIRVNGTPLEIIVIQCPESVSLWCLRAVLREMNLLQSVEAAIAQIPDNKLRIKAEEGFKHAPTIERNHDITLFLKQVLNLTEEQVDNIFIEEEKMNA